MLRKEQMVELLELQEGLIRQTHSGDLCLLCIIQ